MGGVPTSNLCTLRAVYYVKVYFRVARLRTNLRRLYRMVLFHHIVRFLLLGLLPVLALPLAARAQADTALLASVEGQPGQILSAHNYSNPQGTRVHKYHITLSPAQAATLGLILHTGGGDSLDVRVLTVSGMRMLGERRQRISSKDLLLLGPDATQPVDCGTSQPCKPNRLVVDLRLANSPHGHLWVCQIALEEEK